LFLQMQRHHVELLRKEADNVHPVEACGMLFGNLFQNKAVVEEVSFAPNKLKSAEKFEIDPVDAVVAFAAADKKGLEFIGLFHSHPAPAEPSSLDLKAMEQWGDALWLILSSVDGNLAAYQLIGGKKLEQVTIKIE
jgi:proteasome lid subunit RPN8/RPN11